MDEEGGHASSHPPPPPPPPTSTSGLIMQACPKFPQHAAYLLEQLNMQRYYGSGGGGAGEFCDVTVRVEGCDFRLHRCVLAAVSSKLQAMMYSMGGQQEDSIISLKDVTVTGFRIVMDCVYSGVLRLDTVHVNEVLSAAHCLGLHDIHRACRDFLRQVHIDLQPRSSNAFDSMQMFRPNVPMMNNMQYSGIPLDPNLQQGFPGDIPNHQGIPQDQQSIPPEADDMCSESRGNTNGISHAMHTNDPRMQQQQQPDGLHKNMNLSDHPKLLQPGNNLVNQTVLTDQGRLLNDQGRLLNDQTFNLNQGFNSSPHGQLLSHGSLQNNGYPQTNEQLIPLNLHRVPNNQLVLDPDKEMELNNQAVLPNQGLGADQQLLGSQGFDNNGSSLLLTNDQYGSAANLLGNNLQQEENAQMLGSGEMMTGPLTPMHHHPHHHQHHLQHQPLTPASTHQTEPPHTPTPTPPLQQHGFPMPIAQNCIEDYLKLFDCLGPDQQHSGHLTGQTDPLQMDTMTTGVYGNGGSNGGSSNKQDYSRMGNLIGGMDMDQNLIPPPLPPGSMPQLMPTYSNTTNYVPTSMPVTRPMDQVSSQFLPPPPPLSVSTSLASRSPPQATTSNFSSTAEDVRKTILSVLSQERFDEDEDSLVKTLEGGSKSNSKESVPLTSLLNIATVNQVQKQYQDINLDSTGFQMGKILFKGPDNEDLGPDKNGIDSDSDNEGNLVIVEPNFDYIANSSNSIDLENQTMNDTVSKWPTGEVEESPPQQQSRLNFSEYEDDYRHCSNTDVQMENNFAKPLKKRLRLKLKVNGENDESEVNTPNESDTLALPDLSSQDQCEPVSRKKHILGSSKNLESFQVLTTPTDANLPVLEFNRSANLLSISPIKDISVSFPSATNDKTEDVYQVQSKKQKASSKQQENKEKEKEAAKNKSETTKQTPPMKPPHRKLKCNEDEGTVDIPPESKADTPKLPMISDTEETQEEDDERQEETQDKEEEDMDVDKLLPPLLEAAIEASTPEPSSEETREKSPPRLVRARRTNISKVGKKQIKQSNKDNVKFTDKKESTTAGKVKPSEFHCQLCGRVFPKADRLEFHLNQHKKNELHPCKQCGQEFGRIGELTRHERQHSETVYKCRTCSAEFHSGNLYKAHCFKVHKIKRMFYCSFPDCSFDSEKISLLEKHKLVHSENKTYHCENCGQSFRQPNGLRSHKQSCQKRSSHECKICSKKFHYRQGLQQHESVHTGIKANTCSLCFKNFNDPRNLKRHMRIHEDTYPYQCPQCPKKYRFSNTLKKHMLHHGPAKSIKESTTSETKTKARTVRPLKTVRRTKSSDAVVVIPNQEAAGEPRLWDATAVTVKNSAASGEEIMKVKLEASLVTDSGYV